MRDYAMAASNTATPVLLLTQVIIRHADRAPFEINNEKALAVFHRGPGELSDEGIVNAGRQGQAFRQRYSVKKEDVKFRVSFVPRVVTSAANFATGLLGMTMDEVANEVPMPKDKMLVPDVFSKEMHEYASTILGIDVPPTIDINSNLHHWLVLFEKSVEQEPSCKFKCHHELDELIAYEANSKVELTADEVEDMPEAKRLLFRFMMMLMGAGDFSNPAQLKRNVGELADTLFHNMDQAIADPFADGTKLFVFYTHDTNVVALSEILGFISSFGDKGVDFSAAVAIELWRDEGGNHVVKFVLKNGVNADFKEIEGSRGIEELKKAANERMGNVA